MGKISKTWNLCRLRNLQRNKGRFRTGKGTPPKVCSPSRWKYLGNQFFEAALGSGASEIASVRAGVVLLCNKLSMPTQQRVWRDDGVESPQGVSTKFLGRGRKQASLLVCEPNAAVLAKLLLQNTILGCKICIRCVILPVDKGRQAEQRYKPGTNDVHLRIISIDWTRGEAKETPLHSSC